MNPVILAFALLSRIVSADSCHCSGLTEQMDSLRNKAISNIPAHCKKATADLFAHTSRKFNTVQGYGPYHLSMAPTVEERRHGLAQQLRSIAGSTIDRYQEVATGHLTQYKNAQVEPNERLILKYNITRCKDAPHKQLGLLKRFSSMGCGWSGSRECARAFNDIVEVQMPCGGYTDGHISMPDKVLEMGLDTRYERAAVKLSAKVIDRIQKIESKGSPATADDVGDLFDDAVQAFKSEGLGEVNASQFAFNLLGLYGSRGAAISPLINLVQDARTAQVIANTIGIVASAISVLDHYGLALGKQYSLPKEVSSTCDYTRPYHFWMGAYLAKELRARGHKSKAIIEAVNSIGSLYEQFADVITNGPNATNRDAHIIGNSLDFETQKDIIFNDVGAAWAARILEAPQLPFQIEVNSGLKKMLESGTYESQNQGVLGFLQASAVSVASAAAGVNMKEAMKWREKMAPDAHLRDLLLQSSAK